MSNTWSYTIGADKQLVPFKFETEGPIWPIRLKARADGSSSAQNDRGARVFACRDYMTGLAFGMTAKEHVLLAALNTPPNAFNFLACVFTLLAL